MHSFVYLCTWGFVFEQSIEHGVQGMGLDGGNQRDSYTAKTNSQSNTTSAAQPKKTTWASIASQPVKSSQTRISSTLKKKPGMPSHIKVPPPPMIPGKHNLEIGTVSIELKRRICFSIID